MGDEGLGGQDGGDDRGQVVGAGDLAQAAGVDQRDRIAALGRQLGEQLHAEAAVRTLPKTTVPVCRQVASSSGSGFWQKSLPVITIASPAAPLAGVSAAMAGAGTSSPRVQPTSATRRANGARTRRV